MLEFAVALKMAEFWTLHIIVGIYKRQAKNVLIFRFRQFKDSLKMRNTWTKMKKKSRLFYYTERNETMYIIFTYIVCTRTVKHNTLGYIENNNLLKEKNNKKEKL